MSDIARTAIEIQGGVEGCTAMTDGRKGSVFGHL
jgi:hypothetical protein